MKFEFPISNHSNKTFKISYGGREFPTEMLQKSGPSGLQCILIYLICCLSSLGLINILYIFAIINKTLNIITHGKIWHITGFLWLVFSDIRTERHIFHNLRSVNSVWYQSLVCKQKTDCLLLPYWVYETGLNLKATCVFIVSTLQEETSVT